MSSCIHVYMRMQTRGPAMMNTLALSYVHTCVAGNVSPYASNQCPAPTDQRRGSTHRRARVLPSVPLPQRPVQPTREFSRMYGEFSSMCSFCEACSVDVRCVWGSKRRYAHFGSTQRLPIPPQGSRAPLHLYIPSPPNTMSGRRRQAL